MQVMPQLWHRLSPVPPDLCPRASQRVCAAGAAALPASAARARPWETTQALPFVLSRLQVDTSECFSYFYIKTRPLFTLKQ